VKASIRGSIPGYSSLVTNPEKEATQRWRDHSA
jgi:hypothetical protein